MGTDFLQNKTNLVKALENYIKNLNDLKSKIENDNKNSILIDLNNIEIKILLLPMSQFGP